MAETARIVFFFFFLGGGRTGGHLQKDDAQTYFDVQILGIQTNMSSSDWSKLQKIALFTVFFPIINKMVLICGLGDLSPVQQLLIVYI